MKKVYKQDDRGCTIFNPQTHRLVYGLYNKQNKNFFRLEREENFAFPQVPQYFLNDTAKKMRPSWTYDFNFIQEILSQDPKSSHLHNYLPFVKKVEQMEIVEFLLSKSGSLSKPIRSLPISPNLTPKRWFRSLTYQELQYNETLAFEFKIFATNEFDALKIYAKHKAQLVKEAQGRKTWDYFPENYTFPLIEELRPRSELEELELSALHQYGRNQDNLFVLSCTLFNHWAYLGLKRRR